MFLALFYQRMRVLRSFSACCCLFLVGSCFAQPKGKGRRRRKKQPVHKVVPTPSTNILVFFGDDQNHPMVIKYMETTNIYLQDKFDEALDGFLAISEYFQKNTPENRNLKFVATTVKFYIGSIFYEKRAYFETSNWLEQFLKEVKPHQKLAYVHFGNATYMYLTSLWQLTDHEKPAENIELYQKVLEVGDQGRDKGVFTPNQIIYMEEMLHESKLFLIRHWTSQKINKKTPELVKTTIKYLNEMKEELVEYEAVKADTEIPKVDQTRIVNAFFIYDSLINNHLQYANLLNIKITTNKKKESLTKLMGYNGDLLAHVAIARSLLAELNAEFNTIHTTHPELKLYTNETSLKNFANWIKNMVENTFVKQAYLLSHSENLKDMNQAIVLYETTLKHLINDKEELQHNYAWARLKRAESLFKEDTPDIFTKVKDDLAYVMKHMDGQLYAYAQYLRGEIFIMNHNDPSLLRKGIKDLEGAQALNTHDTINIMERIANAKYFLSFIHATQPDHTDAPSLDESLALLEFTRIHGEKKTQLSAQHCIASLLYDEKHTDEGIETAYTLLTELENSPSYSNSDLAQHTTNATSGLGVVKLHNGMKDEAYKYLYQAALRGSLEAKTMLVSEWHDTQDPQLRKLLLSYLPFKDMPSEVQKKYETYHTDLLMEEGLFQMSDLSDKDALMKALHNFDHACTLNPTLSDTIAPQQARIYFALTQLAHKSGSLNETTTYAEKALSLDPTLRDQMHIMYISLLSDKIRALEKKSFTMQKIVDIQKHIDTLLAASLPLRTTLYKQLAPYQFTLACNLIKNTKPSSHPQKKNRKKQSKATSERKKVDAHITQLLDDVMQWATLSMQQDATYQRAVFHLDRKNKEEAQRLLTVLAKEGHYDAQALLDSLSPAPSTDSSREPTPVKEIIEPKIDKTIIRKINIKDALTHATALLNDENITLDLILLDDAHEYLLSRGRISREDPDQLLLQALIVALLPLSKQKQLRPLESYVFQAKAHPKVAKSLGTRLYTLAEKNKDTITNALKISAHLSNADALFQQGWLYYYKDASQRTNGLALLKEAAFKKNHGQAFIQLINACMIRSDDITIDEIYRHLRDNETFSVALKACKEALKGSNPYASYLLGKIYLEPTRQESYSEDRFAHIVASFPPEDQNELADKKHRMLALRAKAYITFNEAKTLCDMLDPDHTNTHLQALKGQAEEQTELIF